MKPISHTPQAAREKRDMSVAFVSRIYNKAGKPFALILFLVMLAACMAQERQRSVPSKNSDETDKVVFRDVSTGRDINLGEVALVRAEVVNRRFNVAVTLDSQVILQINGLACKEELPAGRHGGNEFRAVLMHTPWGDAALLGEGMENSLEVAHTGPERTQIAFSVVVKGLGRQIAASGSVTTSRRFSASSVGTDDK